MITDNRYYNVDLAPTQDKDRAWDGINFFVLWVAMSATILTYMCGSVLIAKGMLWWEALIIVFLGSVIILIPILLNAHVGTKYGIPFPVYCRSSFGIRGANIPVLFRALIACVWFGIVCWIGSSAIYNVLTIFIPAVVVFPKKYLGINLAQLLCFLFFWSIHFFAVRRGIKTIQLLLKIKAPLLIFSGLLLLLWALLKAKSLGPILLAPANHKPLGEQFWQVFPIGLTSVVSSWSTIALNIPDFTRFAHSQKSQIIGQTLGLPMTIVFFSFVGIAVTSATAVIYGKYIWNPVDLILHFSNVWGLIFAVFVMIVASLATNMAVNVVSPANDFSNMWPRKISFKTGAFITMVIGVLIQPWKIMASLDTYLLSWLTAYSSLLGAIAGILIADYYILKKANLDTAQLYIKDGKYWYTHGFNCKALIACALAILPCIPGFLSSLGVLTVARFWLGFYEYAWFGSLFIAFFAYLLISKKDNGAKNIN
jgi:nucleobase:cation symporter-1, NCS1 family